MRTPTLAVAALAIALAIGIATVGHHPTLTIQQLQQRCEDANAGRHRVSGCKAILKRDITPEYRGAINTQLCAALMQSSSWLKAIETCKLGNIPIPQAVNYANLGAAQYGLGDMLNALDSLEKAGELNPKLVAPYCNRGYIYKSQGDPAKARAEFDKANKVAKESKDPDPLQK